MKNLTWLKIGGAALLVHIVLISLSILEVFVYSTLVNKGQTQAVYEKHAELTAPYIATIAGCILMYFFVTRFTKNKAINPWLPGLGLPAIYIIIDFVLLQSTSPGWTKQLPTILGSNFLKSMAAVLAAYRSKQQIK